jgi:hypothetical protein
MFGHTSVHNPAVTSFLRPVFLIQSVMRLLRDRLGDREQRAIPFIGLGSGYRVERSSFPFPSSAKWYPVSSRAQLRTERRGVHHNLWGIMLNALLTVVHAA